MLWTVIVHATGRPEKRIILWLSQRLRDVSCGIWLWSRLVIIVPGPLVFMIGLQIAYPEAAPIVYAEMARFLILAALGVPLNLRISRKYQREINELESLQKDQL